MVVAFRGGNRHIRRDHKKRACRRKLEGESSKQQASPAKSLFFLGDNITRGGISFSKPVNYWQFSGMKREELGELEFKNANFARVRSTARRDSAAVEVRCRGWFVPRIQCESQARESDG